METIFKYNNHEIVFEKDEEVMVNATQMAKAFGKRLDSFMRTESTKFFIKALEQTLNSVRSEPFTVFENRGHLGLWVHRSLALKLAAWLSPEFEVWVYQTIEQVLFGRQFEHIREWYDVSLACNQREREIKNEKRRLMRVVKQMPIFHDRKAISQVLDISRVKMNGVSSEIDSTLNIFNEDNENSIIRLSELVSRKRVLENEIREKQAELYRLNQEYNEIKEVQKVFELNQEAVELRTRKAELTKNIYSGQLSIQNS